MGNNYCKQLGIKPKRNISVKDFEKIWKKYNDENLSAAHEASLDKRAAKKFLKHFAAAIGEEYDETKAEKLIKDCDELGTGYINYEQFKKLFFQVAISTKRIGLTQSLQVKLKVRSTIWTTRALRMTQSSETDMGEDNETIIEEFEAADDQYFFLDKPIQNRQCPFQIVNMDQLESQIQSTFDEVSKLVGLPSADVALLMRIFDWDKEKLYSRYFDKPEEYLVKAGILSKDKVHHHYNNNNNNNNNTNTITSNNNNNTITTTSYDYDSITSISTNVTEMLTLTENEGRPSQNEVDDNNNNNNNSTIMNTSTNSMTTTNDIINTTNKEQNNNTNPISPTQEISFECPVCCDEVSLNNTFASSKCGHRYCKECWAAHLRTTAQSYGTQFIARTKCMTSGCNILLNGEQVRELGDDDTAKRYQYFFLKSFVEVHHQFTFCPADCGRAVRSIVDVMNDVILSDNRHQHVPDHKKPSRDVVECECGKKFCFGCGLEYHNPVNCGQMRIWEERNENDKDSLKLIMAIAKPCPNPDCGIPIDRTDGCNHMTCQKCAHEWCWQCRGPWKEHGDRTGGFYYCNNYESSTAAKMDQEAEQVREDHNRFLHYFNGFHVNDKDEKGTIALKPSLLETANQYRELTGGDPQFLSDAIDTLIQSRHVLKQSYIYSYFLPVHETPQKRVFEMQQAYAQNICERLAGELLNPIEKLDRNKVVYLHKACQQYFQNLVDFFESSDGQALYAMMPKDKKSKEKTARKQQTAWWVCSKCTFGNPNTNSSCELCGEGRNDPTTFF